MSKKEDVSVPAGGFQLEAKTFDAHNMLINGAIGAICKMLNGLDLNHDGISDVAEIAPFVIKLMPIVLQLLPAIEPTEFKAWILSQSFIKDKAVAEIALKGVEDLAADAVKLLPPAGAK